MTLKNIPYEILKEYSIPVEKRIENWQVGIGLNEVDGLKPSKYLIQLTKDSIEGRKNFDEIEKELKTYYEKQDKETINYSEMDIEKQIKNLVKFTSAIWQIHPFIEGNTRTVAVFIQKYLLSMGYDVSNDLFKDNSIYFRNALVASNYSNIPKRVSPNFFYLEQFFLKLLYEKNINLKEIIIFKI